MATFASNPYADNPYVASQVVAKPSAVEVAQASMAPPPTAAQAQAQKIDARTRGVGQNELVQSQIMSILNSENPYIKLAQQKAMEQANARGLLNSSMAAGWGQRAAIESALPIAESDAGAYRQTAADNMSALNAALTRSAELATDTSQFNAGQQNTLTGAHAQHQYGLEKSAVDSALARERDREQHEFGLEAKGREQGYTLEQMSAKQGYTLEELAARQGYTLEELAARQGYTLEELAAQQGYTLEQMSAKQGYTLEELAARQGYTLEELAARQGYTLEELAAKHGYDLGAMAAEFGYDLGRTEMEGYQQRLGIAETGAQARETSAQEFQQDYSIEELKGNIASALSYQEAAQDVKLLWEKHASDTGLTDQKAYYDMASQLRTQVHEKEMEILQADNLNDRERLKTELQGLLNEQSHWQTMAQTEQEYGLKGGLSAQEAYQQGLLNQDQYDHEMEVLTTKNLHEASQTLTNFNNTLELKKVEQADAIELKQVDALIDANSRTQQALIDLDKSDHEYGQKVDFLNRDAEVRAWLAGIEQDNAVALANIQGNFDLAKNMQTVAGTIYDGVLRSMATIMDNHELSGAAVSARVNDLMGTLDTSMNWLTATTGAPGAVINDPTAPLQRPSEAPLRQSTEQQQRVINAYKTGDGDGSASTPFRVAEGDLNSLREAGVVQAGPDLYVAPDGTFFQSYEKFDPLRTFSDLNR